MKDDTITKLYSGLTDRERAALAFDYLMPYNEIEMQRIQAAMPEQYFVGSPLEFRRMFHGFLNISMLYAIEYWRQVAMANIYLAGLNAMSMKTIEATKHLSDEEIVNSTEYQEWEAVLKRFENHEIMLLSLEVAIDEISADHGLNPQSLRGMAGERHYTIIGTRPDKPDREPDAAIVAEFRKMWAENLG